MSGLTFTFSSPAPGLRHWDLRGPAGVVRFETADALGIKTQSVYLHATNYLRGTDVGDCDVCDRGYHDALASKYARSLREAWEIEGCNDDVIRAELERWYHELLLSSPVLADEGSQVSGDEAGLTSGGLESGPKEAATGAGEEVEGPSVDPVPVAAHYQTSGWAGGSGECGVECACGTIFDHFDTIAEAAALLDDHIEREAELARIAEELGEPIEILREVADAMAACGDEEEIERKLDAQTLATPPAPVAAQHDNPTHAEVDHLAEVLTTAHAKGIFAGTWSLARWILAAGYRRQDPADWWSSAGEELASDAARRFAKELERLAEGLRDRGIAMLPNTPIGTVTVDTALAAIDARATYILDAPAILDLAGRYAAACVEEATSGSPKGRESARDEIRDLWDAIRAALTPIPAVDADDDPRHVIDLREGGWTIKHPLSCRPNLFDCPVNRAAEKDLTEPPAALGRFECSVNDLGDRLLIGDRVDEPAPIEPAWK